MRQLMATDLRVGSSVWVLHVWTVNDIEKAQWRVSKVKEIDPQKNQALVRCNGWQTEACQLLDLSLDADRRKVAHEEMVLAPKQREMVEKQWIADSFEEQHVGSQVMESAENGGAYELFKLTDDQLDIIGAFLPPISSSPTMISSLQNADAMDLTAIDRRMGPPPSKSGFWVGAGVPKAGDKVRLYVCTVNHHSLASYQTSDQTFSHRLS